MRNVELRRTSPNAFTSDSPPSQNGALGRRSKEMQCAAPPILSIWFRTKERGRKPGSMKCRLLDLVWSVQAVADSEKEVVATGTFGQQRPGAAVRDVCWGKESAYADRALYRTVLRCPRGIASTRVLGEYLGKEEYA
jgi:hypothetical protein